MLAIHHRKDSFSQKWIEYCKLNDINFECIDIFSLTVNNIVCKYNGLMWNWDLNDDRSILVAKDIIYALELVSFPVFPNFKTCFFYENKVIQKYIFDILSVPTPISQIQFKKQKAFEFISNTSFPLVLKLKTGAGSHNVILLTTKSKAKYYIRKLFSKGISAVNFSQRAKDRLKSLRKLFSLRNLMSFLFNAFNVLLKIMPKGYKLRQNEIGYFYTQQFIENNTYDDRFVIIGNRCYCLRRYCRPNDFRASGSGIFKFNHKLFPHESIKLCFNVAEKLKTQCTAFDVIYKKDKPLIVEISYSFSAGYPYNKCDGYFDTNINWHKEPIIPEYAMIKDFIYSLSA